jgi:hypothetical protein
MTQLKQPAGNWQLSTFTHPQESLKLPSVSAEILLADIYDKLDFN